MNVQIPTSKPSATLAAAAVPVAATQPTRSLVPGPASAAARTSRPPVRALGLIRTPQTAAARRDPAGRQLSTPRREPVLRRTRVLPTRYMTAARLPAVAGQAPPPRQIT